MSDPIQGALNAYLAMQRSDKTAAGRFWFTFQNDLATRQLQRWFLGDEERAHWKEQQKLATDFLRLQEECDALIAQISAATSDGNRGSIP